VEAQKTEREKLRLQREQAAAEKAKANLEAARLRAETRPAKRARRKPDAATLPDQEVAAEPSPPGAAAPLPETDRVIGGD
jgi:hypothetical protein